MTDAGAVGGAERLPAVERDSRSVSGAPRVHAKRYGMVTTDCGIDATSLLVLWGRSFQPDVPNVCEKCAVPVPLTLTEGTTSNG